MAQLVVKKRTKKTWKSPGKRSVWSYCNKTPVHNRFRLGQPLLRMLMWYEWLLMIHVNDRNVQSVCVELSEYSVDSPSSFELELEPLFTQQTGRVDIYFITFIAHFFFYHVLGESVRLHSKHAHNKMQIAALCYATPSADRFTNISVIWCCLLKLNQCIRWNHQWTLWM